MSHPIWRAPAVALALTLLLGPAVSIASPASANAGAASTPKVLRRAFPSRENNLDPAQVSDVVSVAIVASFFDRPLMAANSSALAVFRLTRLSAALCFAAGLRGRVRGEGGGNSRRGRARSKLKCNTALKSTG